ncbi:RNA-guided endonuclease TnpB family protein [Crocosphaera sp.]|uniref:RNA-guided endonuclease TnpB family protein n=1 Tax=Crocosphaera sp. TaxID=2729996 RepID=UPI0026314CC5|nr:RNA-guided endonuclease TnpB family protein [Crocosphaera sp.]
MARHAGYSRWVFNWGLKAWSVTYKEGLKPTANKLKKFYTNYVKPHYSWQSQLSSRVYQYAFVDLGIKTLATLSNGEVFPNLKPYRKAAKKLSRLHRNLSRKVKGSKNRTKARISLASQHLKVANLRRDYLHKITSYLAKNFSSIVIEDLNVKGMLANRKLAKAISELGFYEFRRQLEYKCELYGSKLTIVDRWFPSSKTCSRCGLIKKELSLSERIYRCECGLEMDRDLNAAKVLANQAVGYTVLACGQSAADGSGRSRK